MYVIVLFLSGLLTADISYQLGRPKQVSPIRRQNQMLLND